MTKTKSGCWCRKGLQLRPILREWRKLNQRIARKWNYCGDVPWWYNERASLSVFAGAVWNAGHFAFEEFSDEKRRLSPRSSKFQKPYSGRVDIYFNIRRKDFIAEAKICWPRCGRLASERQKRIEDGLASACRDIRLSEPHGQCRLGILFVTPCWKTSLKREIDQRIDEWIAKVSAIDCDAISWIFPANTRTAHLGKYLFPGAAVLIKEVRR